LSTTVRANSEALSGISLGAGADFLRQFPHSYFAFLGATMIDFSRSTVTNPGLAPRGLRT